MYRSSFGVMKIIISKMNGKVKSNPNNIKLPMAPIGFSTSVIESTVHFIKHVHNFF